MAVAPSESVAVTVNVSVPAAVGVPLIARLPVPLLGTVSPGICSLDVAYGQRDRARAAAGGDRLVVGHADRVGRQRRRSQAQRRIDRNAVVRRWLLRPANRWR